MRTPAVQDGTVSPTNPEPKHQKAGGIKVRRVASNASMANVRLEVS